MKYVLNIIAIILGSLTYAFRGGKWNPKDENGEEKISSLWTRLSFCSVMLTIAVSYLSSDVYVAHLLSEQSGFDYAISAGIVHVVHLVLLYVFVSMGHGSVMDNGRWVTPDAKLFLREHGLPEDYKSAHKNLPKGMFKSRHQFPTTYIFGREDMAWPFWLKWVHNFVGMWFIGTLRHSPILLFIGAISPTSAALYVLGGIAHPFLYELGYWMSRVHGGEKHKIFYAELLTGAYMGGLFYAIAG